MRKWSRQGASFLLIFSLLLVATVCCSRAPESRGPRELPRALELPRAAHGGDADLVRSLLAGGKSPNVRGQWGYTPLQWAAWESHLEIAHVLVEHGADVTAPGDCGVTPLHMAAAGGSVAIARFLIEKGAPVNPEPHEGRWAGWTPLDVALDEGHDGVANVLRAHGGTTGADHGIRIDVAAERPSFLSSLANAASEGDVQQVRALLAGGADVHESPWSGTPLHYAATAEVATLLIDAGANLHVRDADDRTPLVTAIRDCRSDVATLLLARTDAASSPASGDLLWHAVLVDCVGVLKHLVARGANIHWRDKSAKSLLHLAAEQGSVKSVAILLEGGADPAVRDRWGRTPLTEAASEGHRDIVDLFLARGHGNKLCLAAALPDTDWAVKLIAEGADVNSRGDLGETALHWCARRGDRGLAALLIAKGANVDARTHRGETPLYWAGGWLEPELAEFLLKSGADVDARAQNGRTTLCDVLTRGGQGVARVLISHGADVDAKDKKGTSPRQLLKDNEDLMRLVRQREKRR